MFKVVMGVVINNNDKIFGLKMVLALRSRSMSAPEFVMWVMAKCHTLGSNLHHLFPTNLTFLEKK